VADTKPVDPAPSNSRMYAEVRGSRVNTGGGKLYRFFLCGRRDARKETASGTKMRKAGVFEGLDFDDFMNPVSTCHVFARFPMLFFLGGIGLLIHCAGDRSSCSHFNQRSSQKDCSDSMGAEFFYRRMCSACCSAYHLLHTNANELAV
jgi:hypothetical protein